MLHNNLLDQDMHVFFISDRDRFFYLQADSLIKKAGVDASSMLAVVYKTEGSEATLEKLSAVNYVNYEDVTLEALSKAKSFTFMSLNNWNSPIAEKLIKFKESLIEKLYIFITDDEVDRWRRNHEKNGSLLVDSKSHISKSSIEVLKKVRFFIAPVHYFKKTISKSIGRTDIEVYNCSIIFDILPYEASKYLQKSINTVDRKNENNIKRVLIGTKGCELSLFLKVFSVFHKAKRNKISDINILVFQTLKRRVLIDVLLSILKVVKINPPQVTYLSEMPPHLYASTIASCDAILLQDRGGASTARVFCKWGCGNVIVRKGSPNYFFFKDVYNVEGLFFESLEDIPKLLANNSIDEKENATRILTEEKRSIEKFAKLYS